MANKKLDKVVEEVKAFEVELVAKVKSAFHVVCTKFGNVAFEEGKAVVSSESKDLINELQNLNVIEKPAEPTPAPVVAPAPEQSKADGK